MERAAITTRYGALAALAGVLLVAPACATVLGFEDPVDLPADAGGATTFGADATSDTDAMAPEAMDGGDATAREGACRCPVVPEGWRGPLLLEETTGTPAACGGAFPTLADELHAGPQGHAASCTCSCGAPSGIACGAPEASLHTDGACGTTCATGAPVAACSRPTCGGGGGSSVASVRVSATASGGTCNPSSAIDVAAPTWSTTLRLCGGGTTCGADCSANVCIAKAGAATCPSAFPRNHVGYGAFADSRTCTACSCGTPTGAACGGAIATYGSGTCGSALATGSFDTCVPVAGGARVSVTSTSAPQGGSCAPQGGTPTGTVSAQDPTTICCVR